MLADVRRAPRVGPGDGRPQDASSCRTSSTSTGAGRPPVPIGPSTGVLLSVNTSPGGVPKRPIGPGRMSWRGVEGDGHDTPEPIHGTPAQAACLYAFEAIERIRADGHQAFPGAYGENLTIAGLDWGGLQRRPASTGRTVRCSSAQLRDAARHPGAVVHRRPLRPDPPAEHPEDAPVRLRRRGGRRRRR